MNAQRLHLVFASYSLSLPSCCCSAPIYARNGAVPPFSFLPERRRPSSNLPRRKGPVCRHRAQIRPSAAVLVGQAESSRGSAGLRHQVSVQASPGCTCSDDPLCSAVNECNCLHRYAITVWYFDADERARAKEKYLTGKIQCT